MAGLDELFNQIPTQEIASKLGVDEGEVNSAIKTLVPALVGGIQQNVQADDIDSSKLESDVAQQGESGLLDGGVDELAASAALQGFGEAHARQVAQRVGEG